MHRKTRDAGIWIGSALVVITLFVWSTAPTYYSAATAAYVCRWTGFNDAAARHADRAAAAVPIDPGNWCITCELGRLYERRAAWRRFADARRAEAAATD